MTRSSLDARPVALVTGASSLLGREICLELSREGYRIAAHYHRAMFRATELVEMIARKRGEAKAFQADLAHERQANGLVRKTLKKFKRLDLLVNNASLFIKTPFSHGRFSKWASIFRVNLFAPCFLAQAAAPWLRKKNGSIVNIADIYGTSPILRDYSAYCCSKAGLICATKALALELGPKVRVNAVSPGAISFPENFTAFQRRRLIDKSVLKQPGRPGDIARAVAFLARERFVTGQILNIDGGRFLS